MASALPLTANRRRTLVAKVPLATRFSSKAVASAAFQAAMSSAESCFRFPPQRSDADDGQEVFEASEVIDVACVEREIGGHGGGGDQQIDGSGATCFAPRRDDRGVDASIGPRRVAVERQWIEAGLGPL